MYDVGYNMDTSGYLHKFESMHDFENFKDDRPCFEVSEKKYQNLLPLSLEERKKKFRNKPCPCGSKKKFKKCCFYKPMKELK